MFETTVDGVLKQINSAITELEAIGNDQDNKVVAAKAEAARQIEIATVAAAESDRAFSIADKIRKLIS